MMKNNVNKLSLINQREIPYDVFYLISDKMEVINILSWMVKQKVFQPWNLLNEGFQNGWNIL